MRNSHRRTQSDYSLGVATFTKLSFKLSIKQNKKQVPTLLNKTNSKNKKKTVFVETLDIPRVRSHQDVMFYFGRNSFESPTMLSIQHDECTLSPIPQKKSNCYKSNSIQKKKQVEKNNQHKRNLSLKSSNKNSLHHSKFSNISSFKQRFKNEKINKTKTNNLSQNVQKTKLVKNRLKKPKNI